MCHTLSQSGQVRQVGFHFPLCDARLEMGAHVVSEAALETALLVSMGLEKVREQLTGKSTAPLR